MILLDGQTYSVKKYRIRLSVVNPSAVAGSELRSKLLDGQTYSVKNKRICLAVVNPSTVTGLELRSTARQISRKEREFMWPRTYANYSAVARLSGVIAPRNL
jgi:hypothetical protein